MSTKRTRKKEFTRVTKRRNKTILHISLFTFVLSLFSVLLAFFLVKEPHIVSPLPALSHASSDSATRDLDKKLRTLSITPVAITKDTEQIVIKLEKNAEILFSSKRDIHEQLGSLQLIMRQLTMEGKHFARIDLRFDKPVISFSQ